MNETADLSLEEQQSSQRSTILRVYNYYRILLSFLFLFLFLDPDFHRFVGSVNPELFQNTIIFYVIINILIGLTTLFYPCGVSLQSHPFADHPCRRYCLFNLVDVCQWRR